MCLFMDQHERGVVAPGEDKNDRKGIKASKGGWKSPKKKI